VEADFVRRQIKREELAQPSRLDLQHPLGVICLVEGQNVKAEPVPDRPSDPLDLQCEVLPSHILETVPFQVVNELLPDLGEPAVGCVFLGEVDLLPLPGKPGLIGVTGSDDLLGRINDDLAEVQRWGLLDGTGVQSRRSG
jgi:hypothetical protein